MRKLFPFSLFMLFFSAALAQQGGTPATADAASAKTATDALAQASKVSLVSINGLNCPVAASAYRGGAGLVVETRHGEAARPQNELRLNFGPANRSNVTEAVITLHGTDSRPRAELAYSSQSGNLTEEFHLTGTADHVLRTASVSPTKVVNVRWIGISELKFVDGSTWRPSENSYCKIQPNGFRLVAAGEQK